MTAPRSDDFFLKLTGVTKRFGKFTALSNIALTVERGRLVTFLGPSGCGKTSPTDWSTGARVRTRPAAASPSC